VVKEIYHTIELCSQQTVNKKQREGKPHQQQIMQEAVRTNKQTNKQTRSREE
jgi:hypothetical protein